MQLFLSPKEISDKLVKIGIKKTEANIFEFLFLGILAGIYIGFGAQCNLAILSGGIIHIISQLEKRRRYVK